MAHSVCHAPAPAPAPAASKPVHLLEFLFVLQLLLVLVLQQRLKLLPVCIKLSVALVGQLLDALLLDAQQTSGCVQGTSYMDGITPPGRKKAFRGGACTETGARGQSTLVTPPGASGRPAHGFLCPCHHWWSRLCCSQPRTHLNVQILEPELVLRLHGELSHLLLQVGNM